MIPRRPEGIVTTRPLQSTLADLPLETEYRSDSHDLVRDFYLPCLTHSTQYRRAVGYFTSRGLSVAAQGITALVDGGGRMLLVASPLFDADDLVAIRDCCDPGCDTGCRRWI